MKYSLMILLVIFQMAGHYFLVQHQYLSAIICFSLNGLTLVILLVSLVKDRMKAKKEENIHDYRDY